MKFGCHISIRNGYVGAAMEAKRIGAHSFQYFPKNPRSLAIKSYDENELSRCKEFSLKNNLLSIAHTPYPTKLVVEKEEAAFMVESVLNDLEIADGCGSLGVVVHFGVAKDQADPLEGYKRMIDLLNRILQGWKGNCLLLIENNAGKSGTTGTTLEELVQIRKLTDYPEKIGFCLDTCHLFASGVWDGDNWGEVEQKGIELDFFKELKAIHLNNSMYPTRSMKDRHANIHSGEITIEQMKKLITSPLLAKLPFILETPSSKEFSHRDEIDFLKKLI